MARKSGPERRQFPRHPTRHRVEGVSLDGRTQIRGILRDLSAGGCSLQVDTRIPPATGIEIQMVTAVKEEETGREAPQMGVSDYITKSLDFQCQSGAFGTRP